MHHLMTLLGTLQICQETLCLWTSLVLLVKPRFEAGDKVENTFETWAVPGLLQSTQTRSVENIFVDPIKRISWQILGVSTFLTASHKLA
ncbi:hypothetical protein WJX79_002883 [Trebouxia sp. C0005]